jgi:4-hydroxy-2-oxoglutarate aldolase
MNLAGVFAPMPTPFDASDRVDTARLRKALSRWLRTPLAGFVVLGSNGEAVLIDDDECDRLIGETRDAVPSDRCYIVGTGRESTRATVTATRRAAALGADAVLVRTPGFFKAQMTTEVFVRHYTAVADASRVPVLLYNFTAVTGVKLLPAAVAQLSTHPNIIGVKESSGDIANIAELVSGTPDRFGVLAGSATTFHAALMAGAVGGILALGCVLPEACVRLFDLASQGRHDDARDLQRRLAPISRLATSIYGVAGLKAALNILGYDVGVPRAPLVPAPAPVIAELTSLLESFQKAFA